MQNLGLAIGTNTPCEEITILTGGVESLALAAILSAKGLNTCLAASGVAFAKSLKIQLVAGCDTRELEHAPKLTERIDNKNILILSARACDYAAAINQVLEEISSGQSLFIFDAPLGTALELSQRLSKLHKKTAINIIEMGSLFGSCILEGGIIKVAGLKEQVSICGCSVNETRTGLSIGKQLWDGLLPASNVFERGLNCSERFVQTVFSFFAVMGISSAQKDTFTETEKILLLVVQQELKDIGKHFNVLVADMVAEKDSAFKYCCDSQEQAKATLQTCVCEDLLLVADLAQLIHHGAPAINAMIDLSSVLLNTDLRKKARRLSDLGLIGMDACEIKELINS